MSSNPSERSILTAYLRALVEAPLNIIFIILDIVAVAAIISWVVDDASELIVVIAFVVVLHAAHYYIFRKQQIELRQLSDRLNEIEKATPDLSLIAIYEDQEGLDISIELPLLPQEPDYEALVTQEADHLANAFKSPPGQSGSSSLASIERAIQASLGHRKKDEEKYKEECENYLAQYDRYLRRNCLYAIYKTRLRSIRFSIKNSGHVPAEDVFVFFDFPDVFVFPTYEEKLEIDLLREEPEVPERPEVYTSIFGQLLSSTSLFPQIPMAEFIQPNSFIDHGPQPNVRGPFIKPKDSTEIQYEITKLMHEFDEPLDEVEFLISEDAIDKGFSIPFRIHSSNIRERIGGTLLISVRIVE
jgi:hypothetical protein